MKKLTENDRQFLNDLLKYSARLHNGYYVFQPRNKRYGNTKYKRGRIIMQLHLDCWLNAHELVHHKDEDRTNDSINNLQVRSTESHSSIHGSGSKKFGKFKPSNKLCINKINEIKKLSKSVIKKNGSPNCEKIGKIVKVSGFTVSRYIKNI